MREMIKLGLILLLITAVAGLVLGVVNSMTADVIEERLIAESLEAMESFFPDLDDASIIDESEFLDYDRVEEGFEVFSNGDVIGYTFKTNTNGYGGTIEMLTGINVEGEVVGIAILSQSETPGLGDVIETDDFKERFVGIDVDGEIDVDTISGATVSSNAVIQGVESAIEVYLEVFGN